MLAALLPGLYVGGCFLALVAALRRWLDPPPWRVALAMLALVLAVLAPVLFGGQLLLPLDNLRGRAPFAGLPAPAVHGNYLQGDLVTLVAPAQARVRAALDSGLWPLWNPLVGTGVPLLGDPQAQAFQPLQLLALPFDLTTAAGVVAALRLLAAMLFTFLLLHRQGTGEGAAFFGGLAWGLGGFLMLWLGWPLANVGALLPLAMWAVARALDRGGRRDLAALAGAVLSLALAGHPETGLEAAALLGVFALARTRRMACHGEPRVARRHLLRAGAAAAIGVLLALPVCVPAARAAARSERAAELLARRTAPAGSVHVAAPAWERDWSTFAIGRLAPLIAPNAFGNNRFADYWGPENSNEDGSGFVGSATTLLALLGLGTALGRRRSVRYPQERLLQLVAALSLGLLVLPSALRPWLDRLPLALQSTTYYHRLLLPWSFALVCLAAYQLDRTANGEGRRWPALAVAAGLAALVVAASLFHPPLPQVDTLDVLRLGWLRWHLRFLAATAAVVAIGGGRWWVPPGAAALVAAELLLAHAPANPPMPPALGFPRLPVLAFLATRPEAQRLLGVDGALPPNLAAVYGLADARAYDPMEPAACATTHAALAAVDAAALAAAGTPLRARVAALGVRHLLAPPGTPAPPGFRKVFADATATVLEAPAAPLLQLHTAGSTFGEATSTKAMPLHAGSGREIARERGDAAPGIRVNGEAAVPRLGGSAARSWLVASPARVHLVLRDRGGADNAPHELGSTLCQDGGWRVLGDGRPLRAVGAPFLAAALPAGMGSVELLYRPPGFLAGCLLAACGAAVLLLVSMAPPRVLPLHPHR